MTKALELAKFGRESAPAGLVVGDSDAQTLSQKTFSDMPTFSGGTANSLAYLNGSKVLTADGALGYDGTTFSTSISVNSQAASIYTRNTNTGTSAWAGLTIGNDISNNRSGILVTSSNRAASGFVGPQSTYIYNSVGLISLVAESNNPIYIGTNNTTRITVLGGGNVGVGIQAPTAILHTQSSGLGDGGGIKLGNSGSGGGTFAIWPTATINGEGADKLIFSGSGGNLFTVTGTGHVGIGTTNPRINTTSVTAGVTTLTIYNSAAGGGGLELATGSTVNTASTGRLAFIAAGNTDGSRNIAWIDSLIQGTTSGNQGGNMRFAVKADNAAVATGMTLDSTGLGIGTAPNSNGRLSVYETTVAKLFLTDSTLGTSYGGQVRGYGTTGAGGYLELGVVDANAFNSAVKVFNQATQISFSINSGSNGSTSERMRIDSNGAAHFYQTGAAAYGGVNLTSADPFIRLTATGGTANKQKWDIRAISASGSEALEFRTINDANNVFSTKLWIGNGGNVGIGTTAPGYKLTVAGANTGSIPLVQFNATGSGTFQRGVQLVNTGMVAGDSLIYSVGTADSSRQMGQMYFVYAGSNSTSNRLSFGLHSVDDVINIFGSGYVGFNTTNPQSPYTFDADWVGGQSSLAVRAKTAGATVGIGLFKSDNTRGLYIAYDTSTNNFQLGNQQNGAIILATNDTERLRVTNTGTVSQLYATPVRKNELSGAPTYNAGGAAIKKVEEMVNFYHTRNTYRYFKLNIAARYATDPMGGAFTITFGKFSEHASLNHWRVYKLLFGSGQGGDPAIYNILYYTEKEVATGWSYYGTTFGFDIYYPNAGTVRDYVYIRLTNADNQGSSQSAHSFLHLEGFIGTINDSISGKTQVLEDLGTTQPSDWSNFVVKASDGAW